MCRGVSECVGVGNSITTVRIGRYLVTRHLHTNKYKSAHQFRVACRSGTNLVKESVPSRLIIASGGSTQKLITNYYLIIGVRRLFIICNDAAHTAHTAHTATQRTGSVRAENIIFSVGLYSLVICTYTDSTTACSNYNKSYF